MTDDEGDIDDIRSIEVEFDEEDQLIRGIFDDLSLVKVSSHVKISTGNRSFDVIRDIFDDLSLVKVSSHVKISARNRSFDVIRGILDDLSLVKVSSHVKISARNKRNRSFDVIRGIFDDLSLVKVSSRVKILSRNKSYNTQTQSATQTSKEYLEKQLTEVETNLRRKEEARNELNVFLGDDNDSFVSLVIHLYCVTVSFSFPVVVGERLCDHLRSNVDLYIQSKESCPDEVAKQKPKETRPEEVDNQKPKESFLNLHNDSERIKLDKFSMSRRSKDWKRTIRDPDEPSLLRSAMIANIHAHDKSYMRQSPSPQPVIERKRDRGVEGGHKYDEASLMKDHK
ncbi:hypothetical protein Tco_0164308 [Tanacetum coccineum]